MSRHLTEKEIKEAKVEKSIREKMRAALEESMEPGKMQLHSTDSGGMWRRVATEDAIRGFCDSIGDTNPLYRSQDYARKSIYGGLIAPPHFLSTISAFSGIGARRKTEPEFTMTGFDAGSQVEWYKIIRENDEFIVFDIPTEVVDLTRDHTPIRFLTRGNRIYKNQRDEVVAVVTGSVIGTVAGSLSNSPGQGTWELPEQRHFSEEEVNEWYQLTEQEEIRGADPRFWEDTDVGDTLPHTHHVCTMMEYIAFVAGRGRWGNWYLQMAQRKNMWQNLIDPDNGLPDFGGLHLTDTSAQRMGMPMTSCAGGLLFNWLGKLVTNWMGDTGFLKKLGVEYRKPLWRGSMALCKGEVLKKYIENDEHLVNLHISIEDHNGNLMIPNGSATVALPSRHMEK
jgi:acyl dehydratase